MDSITHLSQKVLAERARNASQRQQQFTPSTAPPPYSESDSDSDDSDSDDESSPPVKLTLNAAHNIQGSGNLVPTSATPLADATKFSTLLLHAVNQVNAANDKTTASSDTPTYRRPLRVDLTINCGITVVGDRNVVGNVGVKPKLPNGAPLLPPTEETRTTTTATPAVAGAKRKSDESVDAEEDSPATKKAATGGD